MQFNKSDLSYNDLLNQVSRTREESNHLLLKNEKDASEML